MASRRKLEIGHDMETSENRGLSVEGAGIACSVRHVRCGSRRQMSWSADIEQIIALQSG